MPPTVGLIDAREAITAALVAFLKTVTLDSGRAAGPYNFANCLDDWPDPDVPLAYPTASAVVSDGEYYPSSTAPEILEDDTAYKPNPVAIVTTPGQPNFGAILFNVLQKLGEYQTTIQLDLWANEKAQQDAARRAIQDALAGDPAGLYAGLRLNVGSAYYNRVAVFSIADDKIALNESGAFRKERRSTIMIDASTEWVKLVQLPLFNPVLSLTTGFTPPPASPADTE